MLILGGIFQDIKDLKKNRKNNIVYLIWKVLGKSMQDYCLKTTNICGMTKTSLIEKKPQPIGMDIKYIFCGVT